MVSDLNLVQDDTTRMEQKFGVDDPFGGVLKAQSVSLKNQTTPQRQRKLYHRGLVNFLRFQSRRRKKR